MNRFVPVLTSALLAVLGITAGCGGGSHPPVQGQGQGPGGDPRGPFVFMVGPTSDNLFSFKAGDNGALSFVAAAATGHAPSSIAVQSVNILQPTLFVTNSAGNTVSALTLDSEIGRVTPTGITFATGVNPVAMDIRNGAGFVSSTISDFGTLYVLNQGSNSISGFRITDLTGHVAEVPGSPFATQANPQAMAVVTNGVSPSNPTFVYVANGSLGTISAFKANADGSLTELAGSPFGAGANIVAVTGRPSGAVLLASDLGNNKLVAFKIASDGTITPFAGSPFAAGTQPGPIAFAQFSNQFVYVANRGSNNVSAFKLDATAFTLTPIAGSPFAAGTNPVALSATSSQLQLYVANQGSSDISEFRIDITTGVLTPVPASPLHVADVPTAMQTFFAFNTF